MSELEYVKNEFGKLCTYSNNTTDNENARKHKVALVKMLVNWDTKKNGSYLIIK